MKIKHTVYLPKSTLELLDGLWLETRSLFKKKEITKSLLVELAIEMACKDVMEHGTESSFYDQLAQRVDISVSSDDKESDKSHHFWR